MGFLRRGSKSSGTPGIVLTDVGVERTLSSGDVEAVTWDRLARVEVRTTADGPFEEDVYFVLFDGDGAGCVVPQGAAPDGLLDRLQALPGFDNEQLIASMGSSELASFLLWEKAGR